MARVLVVDDDPVAQRVLVRLLSPAHEVRAFGEPAAALRHLAEHGADAVLTDLRMPGLDGIQVLARARELDPEVLVFVITGHSSLPSAVEAIKRGAEDYLAKPFEPEDVVLRLDRALERRRLVARVRLQDEAAAPGGPDGALLSAHPRMAPILEVARRAARTDSTVLIQGETGVGKEVFARLLHAWSPRAGRAFVAVNCGALSAALLESELFGHERGAFTGAVTRRAGYFEAADGGTILLDEIGATTPAFQVRLLRVLQERTVQRVGGTAPIPVDVRVIAATHEPLERAAREGRFRQDLYYRLGVVTLAIPPLRERREDVPALAGHFLRKHRHVNPAVGGISPEGLAKLAAYDYPGNVRELENVIERALILESGPLLSPASLLVGPAASLAGAAEAPAEAPEPLAMDDAEREHVLRVLERCGSRRAEAARALGIDKSTLWRKLKRWGLQD
ncbi:sigma-54-dependent transcriptional regulator [Anaeromyxobacter dehalogenans]|uniref:Two component, sigma54 specific, transcriptional regulator, Fis family n=1 Tax=Anaeromyxobacter dehalogenans (strain 2CP-C) TaxID=290397 RepID=Q2IQG4_ANADE|nr:sigma-54 dependent transcriptional regulator [Anaeromyxobacter dehalogenans]ABC81050.1 two component, sigma54 specific, transcriptional regulator, Fis family [Anaeromyxobacter dehalogenans 2CP-C]